MDGHQLATVKKQRVVSGQVDASNDAVVREVFRAARDRRQTLEIPADAQCGLGPDWLSYDRESLGVIPAEPGGTLIGI